MMDMGKMFGKIQEVQAKMKEAQEKLGTITADGESGGGMVKAVVNGNKKIISIDVEESLVVVEDKEMMQDLIVAAINLAIDEVDVKVKEEMKKTTEGMLPGGIPGFDLSKMF